MSSNMFRAGQKFTGREWANLSRATGYPAVDAGLRLTAKVDSIRDNGSLVIGCRTFNLAGLVNLRKASIITDTDGKITVSATFPSDGQGGATARSSLTHADNPISRNEVVDYCDTIEVVSLPEPVKVRIPTGLYACDAEGSAHDHEFLLMGTHHDGRLRWYRPLSQSRGATAGGDPFVPRADCIPRLRTSFYASLDEPRTSSLPIPVTVEVDNDPLLSNAARLGKRYHDMTRG